MPDKVSAHAETCPQANSPPFVHRSLCNCALCPNPGDDAIHIRFYHHSTYYHLSKCSMESFEVEDEVQLADILKQLIERFHIYLNQVDQREG